MRTTRVLSISMPPGMLQETEELAKKENRTMSELVREALRRYQQEQRWAKIRAIGSARVKALGLKESDVVPLIHEYRREQREKRPAKQRAK